MGGRIPNHLAINFFLNLPLIIWRIFNSIIYTLLPIYICKIATLLGKEIPKEKRLFVNACICALFAFLPISVTNNAIRWISGSFNYSLPVTTLFMAVYPFLTTVMGKETKKRDIVLAWVGVIWSCYVEQTAAVFLCVVLFCIIVSFVKKRNNVKALTLLFVWATANTVVQYIAPGNSVRYTTEMLDRWQTFDILSFWDKSIFGLIHYMKNVFEKNNFYFTIMLCLVGIIVIRKKVFYQIYYLGLWMLSWLTLKVCMYILEDAVIWEITNLVNIGAVGVLVLWVLVMAWSLYDLSENKSVGIGMSLSFLASVASGTIIGLSPSVYASGGRVFYLSYALLVFIIALLLNEVLEERIDG